MQPLAPSPIIIGGKKTKGRRVNKSLTAWVKFVKKVAKEEKLTYRDAMMRAKARKDKGEKWMTGGDSTEIESNDVEMDNEEMDMNEGMGNSMDEETIEGGKRRRGTKKRRGSKKRCTRKRCKSKRHHH